MMQKYFFAFVFVTSLGITWADDFIPNVLDSSDLNENAFVIDADDSGGDVQLNFGSSLGEYLQWNSVSLRFDLSDTLRVQGNLESDGNVLTLDADNAGTGGNVDIVAHQGADNDGILRYNATINQWEVSNDGGSFVSLGGGSGGGATITQYSQNIESKKEVLLTHATDANYERITEVFFEDVETATIENWQINEGDESDYTQENATISSFTQNILHLEPSGGFTIGSTNLSLSATAIASETVDDPNDANDDDTKSYWYNKGGGTSSDQWWGVDMGSSQLVNRAEIRWFNSSYYATDMNIEGSHDGMNWHLVANVNPTHSANTETFDFDPGLYRYWRMYCVVGNDETYFAIKEGRFFGGEGSGYSTTPVYVYTGSAKQLATTIWDDVTGVDIVSSEPSGTELRFLFSFDGGTTWRSWNGSAWVAQTLGAIETSGMTTATVEALTAGNWDGTDGLNSDASETLDYAVSLKTNDSDESPFLADVLLTYDSKVLWEYAREGVDVTLRYISPTVTYVKNLLSENKNFKVNILLPE